MAGPIRMAILANGRQAKREIDSVSSALDRLERTGIGSAVSSLDGMARGAGRASLATTGVASALAAAGAAAGPLLAIGGGVTAAMGAAGIGVGAFAALAGPAFAGVSDATAEATKAQEAYAAAVAAGDAEGAAAALKAQEAALASLTPAQREATTATLDMRAAFTKASEGFATPSLEAYARGLRTLTGLIPLLIKVATPVQTALVVQFERLREAVAGPEFAAFADRLSQHVGPILTETSNLVANIGMTLGHVIDQGLPFAAEFLGIFTGLFGQLREASASSGLAEFFQKMLPHVQELADFVGTLAGAFKDLIVAAEPLAGPLLTTLKNLAGSLGKLFKSDSFQGFVQGLGNAFTALSPVLDTIIQALGPIVEAIGAQLGPIIKALTPFVEQFADTFTKIVQAAAPLLPVLASVISSIGQALLPVLAQLVPAIADAVLPVLQTLAAEIPKLAPEVLKIVQSITPLLPQLAQILISVIPIIPKVVELVAAFVQWYESSGSLKTQLDILQAAVAAAGKIITGVCDLLIGILTGDWSKAWNGAVTLVSGAWGLIVAAVRTGINNAITMLQTLFPKARENITKTWTAVKDATVGGFTKIVSSIGTGVSDAVAKFKALPSKIGDVFRSAGTWLKDAGKRIMDGLISGIQRGIDRVRDMLSNVTDMIPAWKGPPSKDATLLFDAGRSIMGGLVDGLESGERAVRDQLTSLTSWIQNGLDNATAADLGMSIEISGTALAAAGAGGTTVYQIDVHAPVGSSSADIGRELVQHIESFEAAGGRRRAA